MAPIIKTTSYSGLRDQISANLKVCFPTKHQDLEIVTSTVEGYTIAWVIDMKTTPHATVIIKGPPSQTSDEALEGLLEATAVLVGETLEAFFIEFKTKRNVMIGDGFVREDVRPEPELGMFEGSWKTAS